MSGFTPINNKAFSDLIDRLPVCLRLNARSLLVEILFRARRNPDWYDGRRLGRGQFVFGYEELGARCCLSYQSARTIIVRLERVGFLTIKSTKAGSIGSILEFDTYVIDRPKTNEPNNGQLTNVQRTTNDIPKEKGVKEKESLPTCAPDPISQPVDYIAFCFAEFLGVSELPSSVWAWIARARKERSDRLQHLAAACQKQYQVGWGVHGLDQVESGDKAKAAVAYITAIANRSPQMPTAPPTRSVIYDIADSLGDPITDPQERLHAILDGGWHEDPDRGHHWTIPVPTIAQATRERLERQSKGDS